MNGRVAFYAPMKPPGHPVPSGDRRIARLTLSALQRAGYRAETVSDLRILDTTGDAALQRRLTTEAERETGRLIESLSPDPPLAWYTYHSHYKAPDLVGPGVTRALGIPYLVSEPSIAPRRRQGPWSDFARASDAALTAADRLLWTTARDWPGLEAAGHGHKLVHLPAFLELGPPVPPRPAAAPLRLLTVAMMRDGDKTESYRRLAAALALLQVDWRLAILGDGPARATVEAAFAPLRNARLLGATDDAARVRAAMEAADVFVWPGVNEGVGMAWLEAQAAGLPVVAEGGPAAREAIGGGLLTPPDDPSAMAEAIERVAGDRPRWSAMARAHVERHHGLDAAAALIRRVIDDLAAARSARSA